MSERFVEGPDFPREEVREWLDQQLPGPALSVMLEWLKLYDSEDPLERLRAEQATMAWGFVRVEEVWLDLRRRCERDLLRRRAAERG